MMSNKVRTDGLLMVAGWARYMTPEELWPSRLSFWAKPSFIEEKGLLLRFLNNSTHVVMNSQKRLQWRVLQRQNGMMSTIK